ncbi:MAG TPA: RNA polymerase sigma factor [Acidimicrobiia bacterium]|nr:RNA polymerase sigma factor [Acidimicrobiia bacterium]
MDRELLERFRDGDESAVKTVYERFRGPVFAIGMSVLHDHGLAADATQQTFVKAWQAATTYDPSRELAPWIYAIARRTAIDIYRKQSRSIASEDVDTPTLPPALDTIWEVFEVRSALDRLPDDERRVVRLSHFDGLTHSEIAEHMGIPIGTVKSRSHRAHRRLLELLRHLEET